MYLTSCAPRIEVNSCAIEATKNRKVNESIKAKNTVLRAFHKPDSDFAWI